MSFRGDDSTRTERQSLDRPLNHYGWAHYICFDKVSVLARKKHFIPRKLRQIVEIGSHSNLNPDVRYYVVSVEETLERDVVDVVCNPAYDFSKN